MSSIKKETWEGENAAGRPADWQLPAGVDGGLWDYLHSAEVASGYEASLTGSSLFQTDVVFVKKHVRPAARLVDLGCGTGRLLRAMADYGCWCLGVDLSLEMLQVARARTVDVALMRANLVDLRGIAPESFDAAACLFSTLGMLRGKDERRKAVEEAHRILKPGGVFILHVHNRWFNAWNREGRRWLLSNAWKALWGKATAGDRLMPVHQGVANLTLHLFTRREACRLLRSVGFRIREVRPISLREDGRLCCAWWFGWLRAYGYLVAAEK